MSSVDPMNDSAFSIDALRAQIKGIEGFAGVAQAMAQYYDALIKAGLPKSLAESLALQWHLLVWTHALAMPVASQDKNR